MLEKLAGVDSGVMGPEGNDTFYIEAQRFRMFVQQILQVLSRSGSEELHIMVAGVLQVALILDFRANGVWLEVDDRFADLRRRAQNMRLHWD